MAFITIEKSSFIKFSDNLFRDIGTLSSLTELQNLVLSHDKLSNIDSLLPLTGLQSLDLGYNQLINIDPLTSLTNLKSLILRNNQLTDISPLTSLVGLQSLTLRFNELRDISPLSSLTRLQSLDLGYNNISTISSLSSLTELQSLDLSNNQLSNINTLSALTDLKSLNLTDNMIREISLPLLEDLNLELELDVNNDMLGKIGLRVNPLEIPPLEVLKQGREFSIEFLRSKDKQPLNECKVIIIGRGGAGKTSLQKRLTDQPFDPSESQTHGIRKMVWSDGIKAADGEPITINFWDFGGQEIQQALHQFFYTRNALYILVLNQRLDEDPENFLELVRNYGHNSPVLIAYNNIKNLNNHELLTYNAPELDSSLYSKYPNIGRTFGLCCGQDHDPGIGELRKYLQQYIPTLHHVQRTYPRSWLKIKHKLIDKVQNNYIFFDDYEKICREYKVVDQEIQRSLAEMLNTVGTITFFDKEFRGNRYIFNPDWVTTGTYEIIDSEYTKKKKGRINGSDLKNIFSRNLLFIYQAFDYEILLQLMKKFDLCHSFDDGEWLIPSSLEGKSKTDLIAFKENGREYRLQYKASLPSSIIHRFIVHNINYVHDNDYWKNGIVVKHYDSDTKLFVEADSRERQIRLFAKGERIRDCWESFRRNLKDFSKGFDYEELVILSSGDAVSYQYLVEAWEFGLPQIFISKRTGMVNVQETLGLFERQNSQLNLTNRRVPVRNLNNISNISSEILHLIGQNNIEGAFNMLDELNISDQSLSQLRQEFEGGHQEVDYIQRLRMCIKRITK